jgi:gamma-glutamyl:cysteine ligase YbdK (ATP-grasp superfamily)
VFAAMLRESRFDFERPMTGLEIELNLVDPGWMPTMRNADVLAAIADPHFQTELGQFNVEINVPPRRLAGRGTAEYEEHVQASLNAAEEKARALGAHMVMIGLDRPEALCEVVHRYVPLMHSNQPVHEWPVGG